MTRAWIVIAIGFVFSTSSQGLCDSDPSDLIVAEFGDRTITLEEFNLEYMTQFRVSPEDAPLEKRVAHLERMVQRSVAAEEARANGYVWDIGESQLLQFRRRVMVYELFRVYGRPDTIRIREETLRREWEMGNSSYHIRAIMVDSRSEAEEILALLKKGEDFYELAKTRGQGVEAKFAGELGWKTWAELRLTPEIREAVVEMKPGELSDVLESKYGFHVILLEDARPRPQDPYELMREHIYMDFRRERVQASMNRFREAFAETKDVAVSAEGVALIADRIEEARAAGRADAFGELLSEEEKAAFLVSFEGGGWSVGEFLDYARMVGQRFPKTGFDGLYGFVERNVINNLLVEEAERRGIDETPGFKTRMAVLEEVSLESRIRQARVDSRFRVTPVMVETYYEEHKPEFMAPEAVHVRWILVNTRAEADSVWRALRRGADFAEMAKKRSVQTSSAPNGGNIGYISRGQMGGRLDNIVFVLEEGKFSEPFPHMGYWGIVQRLDTRAARQLELDEVNLQIVRDLEPVAHERAYQEWITRLMEKYNAVLYPERLG